MNEYKPYIVTAAVSVFLSLILIFAFGGTKVIKEITERVTETTGGILGAVTNFDVVSIKWLNIGETSSTTQGLYTFYRSDTITGSEDSSRWFNDTGSDAILTDFKVITNTGANATGTFYIHAATTSRPRFFTYTASPHPYLSGENSADSISSTTRLFFFRYATSTRPSILSASTTKHTLSPLTNTNGINYRIGRNDFFVVELYAQSGNCSAAGAAGLAAGNKGKCEEATSTNTGIKPITWFATLVATTTVEARR